MKFSINNKTYESETQVSIYEFAVKNNIFIPSLDNEINSSCLYDLCYVEIENFETLQNAKTTLIFEDANIYTNSTKVYEYLNNIKMYNESKLFKHCHKQIYLNAEYYNILLCQPECYNDCLVKYQNIGFDEIVNSKFSQMIMFIEMTHRLLIRIAKKLDYKTKNPIVILPHNIIQYPKQHILNIKPSEEIAGTLIKKYYKEILKIDKPINIIYVTNELNCTLSQNLKSFEYQSDINDIVLFNNFDIENSLETVVYKQDISNEIYKKTNEHMNISCNYNTIFKLFNQMGFIEEALDIYTNIYGKVLVAKYKGFEIKCLFTKKYLQLDEILSLGYDFVLMDSYKATFEPSAEPGILTDYNVNQIYKKVLEYPGRSKILRRF